MGLDSVGCEQGGKSGFVPTPMSDRVRSLANTRFFGVLLSLMPDKLAVKDRAHAKRSGKTDASAAANGAAGEADASADMEDDDSSDEKAPKSKAAKKPAAAQQPAKAAFGEDMFAMQLHQYWTELESNGFTLAQSLSAEGVTARASALKAVDAIRSSLAKNKAMDEALRSKHKAFESFFLHVALFQLTDPEFITPLLDVRISSLQHYTTTRIASDVAWHHITSPYPSAELLMLGRSA